MSHSTTATNAPAINTAVNNTPVTSLASPTSEQQLCFAAAICCTAAGVIGWVINQFNSGSTSLDALLVVGAFYFFNGAVAAWRNRPGHDAALTVTTDRQADSTPVETHASRAA